MNKAIWWLIVILRCGLAALIIYYALPRTEPKTVAQPTAPAIMQPPPSAESQIRYPIAHQAREKPLPALQVSDATMQNAIGDLLSVKTLIEIFQWQDFVRRVVATVDNLPREKLALRLMPMKPAAGKFLITGKDESLAIDAGNSARYGLYLWLANALDTEKLVAFYVYFYPLFQQAYQELG